MREAVRRVTRLNQKTLKGNVRQQIRRNSRRKKKTIKRREEKRREEKEKNGNYGGLNPSDSKSTNLSKHLSNESRTFKSIPSLYHITHDTIQT